MSLATKLVLGIIASGGSGTPGTVNVDLAGVASTAQHGTLSVSGNSVNVSLTGVGSTLQNGLITVSGGAGSSITTLTLNNLSTTTSYVAPHVTYGHPFADGDVPAGGSVTMTDSNSNPVTVQMDAINTWPSGCVKLAVISHACAETFGTTASKTYTISKSTNPPNNTPNFGTWGGSTHAAWAATLAANSDFKVVYGPGYNAGSNTYSISLNSIFSNYSERNPGWGTSYPTGGWEITKKGPACIEFHGWQYIKNDSTGKFHGYVRCDIWVKAWSPTGPYEVDVRTCQPNIWNTITQSSATSEMYNVSQGRWATLVQVKNGSTVIKYDGGPNDTNAATVPNVNFNTATNRLNYLAYSFFPQTAIYFTSTGSLPTGILANTLYWPSYPNGADQPFLATQQFYCSFIEQNSPPAAWQPNISYGIGAWVLNNNTWYSAIAAGVSGPSGGPIGGGPNSDITDGTVHWTNFTIPFTDTGTGTITANPIPMCFGSTGWATAAGMGDPIWSGSGTRPPIVPGHNFNYLTTNTKYCMNYQAAAGFNTTNLVQTPYLPNHQTAGMQWFQSATGASSNRIGYMNQWQVASLYGPADPYYYYGVVQGALCWNNEVYMFMFDESGGAPFVGNNGPNNSGTAYPGLPSCIPGWCQFNVTGSVSGSIVARGANWSPWDYTIPNSNGLGGQYYADNTHVPMNSQVAYMKTGRPIMLEIAINQCNAYANLVYQGYQVLGGTSYYNLANGAFGSNQLRGWAWSWRTLFQAMFLVPDDHLMQPVIKSYYDDNINFEAARITSLYPPNQLACGIPNCLDHDNGGAHYAPWMLAFYHQVVGTEAWRGGQTSTAATALNTNVNFLKLYWNNFLPSVNTLAPNFYPVYDFVYAPASQDWAHCYTNPVTMMNAAASLGLIPMPWINYLYDHDQGSFHVGFPGNTDSYHVFGQAAVSMMVLAVPGDTTLASVKTIIKNTLSTASGISSSTGGIQWSGTASNGQIVNVQTHAVF